MSHFSLKSLAFYGTAIGSVLLLFNIVTAYGESSLKAPSSINGRYRLQFSQNLPDCEKSDSVLLNIQQSGIYLNASALAMDTDHEASTKSDISSLSGILNGQSLKLKGSVTKLALCNMTDENKIQGNIPIELEMDLATNGANSGQLIMEKSVQPIPFQATIEKPQEQSGKSNSH
jgi:hypothetical protein